MKLKNIILGLALFLVAGLASADNCFRGPCEKADLPTCDSKLKGIEFMVKNCVSTSSCATTASPGFAIRMVCDYTGSAWAYRMAGAPSTSESITANVTVADDGAGTKPAAVIPITTDRVTCTCNDATGCAASIAEPTPTSGYSRELEIVSVGTGNCEFADAAGVIEIGTAVVLEPTSVLRFVYINAAWHNVSYKDNVP